jgi:hypothetical protein
MAIMQLVHNDHLSMLRDMCPVPFDKVEPSSIMLNASVVTTYTGKVVAIEHTNAIVWRDGKPLTIAFTADFNEINEAFVDADEASQAAYQAYKQQGCRHERAVFLAYQRALKRKDRRNAGLTFAQHRKLCHLYAFKERTYTAVIKLLSIKSHKSPFRESCYNKIRAWLVDGDVNVHPLSAREITHLI